MIGITISLIILSGVIVAFINLSGSATTTIKANRLNNELRTTLDFITRELSKAGYVDAWDDTGASPEDYRIRTDMLELYGLDSTDTVTPDLMDYSGACNVSTDQGTNTCDCILYRYDEDNDGMAGATGGQTVAAAAGGTPNPFTSITDNEFFGFRFDSANNEVDMKTGGAFTDDDCTDGSWQAITSDDIQITALSFQIDFNDSFNDGTNYLPEEVGNGNNDTVCQSGETCLDRRKVNVLITGQLTQDASVTMTINTEVKLMNDRYFTQP